MFNLKQKTILVTGGTSPLGAAICYGLAEYGGSVAVTGRKKEECAALAQAIKERHGVEALGIPLDITDDNSMKTAVAEACSHFGSLDVLVNNACFIEQGDLKTLDFSKWQCGLDGTINGVFKMTSLVLAHFLPNCKGNIINIASMYGVVAPNPDIYGDSGQNSPAAYGAGKAAVIQFTKYLAAAYGRQGLRANCISPGPFPKEGVLQNKEFTARLADKTCLGRVGRPEEIKGLAVLLASDASSYITGQNICIDGGWTTW